MVTDGTGTEETETIGAFTTGVPERVPVGTATVPAGAVTVTVTRLKWRRRKRASVSLEKKHRLMLTVLFDESSFRNTHQHLRKCRLVLGRWLWREQR